MQRNTKLQIMVKISLMSAIGIILFYFIAFPLPGLPSYLTYDPGDIPGILTCFALGPIEGTLVIFLKSFLGFVVGASKAGPVGALSNFLAGAAYTLPAGFFYKKSKTKHNAIIAMILGSLCTTIAMCITNYYITYPMYGIPSTFFVVISGTVPFNLAKWFISSFVTFFIYKKVRKFFEIDK